MTGGSFSGANDYDSAIDGNGYSAGRAVHALSYHGDLNSIERQKNLEQFRTGEFE